MTMKNSFQALGALLAISMLGLSGCNRNEPAPEAATMPKADATEPVSIFRPDVDVERVKTPLEPLETSISFAQGGTDLSAAAETDLSSVLDSPQIKEGGAVILRGHTDSAGFDEANLRASRQRAEAVRNHLVEKGVEAARITVIALGEMRPVAPNAKLDGTIDEQGRAANRRVDVTVIMPGTPDPATLTPDDDEAENEESPTLVESITR